MKTHLYLLFVLASLATASVSARADATAQWTSITAETMRLAREEPATAERRLAAVRHAMATAQGRGNGGGNGNGNGHGNSSPDAQRRDAAVAVAAFAVLEAIYPDQRETLDAQLALTFSHIPETLAKAEGAALGRRIANDILAGIAR